MKAPKHYSPVQIRRVANQVWETLDPSAKGHSISPLFDMISSYPIRTAEIEGLTFQSAAQFLSSETGQIVPVPEDGNQTLAGFLFIQRYRTTLYGCILVEKFDSVVRRRFSAAHELGHYLLHFLPMLDSQPSIHDMVLAEGLTYSDESPEDLPSGKLAVIQSPEQDFRFNFVGDEVVEREANQFAAELLVPEERCKQVYQSFSKKYGIQRPVLIKRLATEFLVSVEAMKWRLMTLRLHSYQ
ncbi:MAG TPA: ImmA/IrrE family metallo-endopeptidase [Oculatellaceae cyanobacterium]